MTLKEFAAFYSTSLQTVRRWVYSGKITPIKNGCEYRVNVAKCLKQLGWSDEDVRIVRRKA
jgi:predicted site-specific integrase-resolvase